MLISVIEYVPIPLYCFPLHFGQNLQAFPLGGAEGLCMASVLELSKLGGIPSVSEGTISATMAVTSFLSLYFLIARWSNLWTDSVQVNP